MAGARRELHQAIQLVSMVGRSYLPQSTEDIHATAEWLPVSQALGGQLIQGDQPFRLALRVLDTTLLILDEKEQFTGQFTLAGKTFVQAVEWLLKEIEKNGLKPDKLSQDLPYTIPEYEVARGAAFSLFRPTTLAELAGYYSNAYQLLSAVKAEFQASSVICWPHHFDLAILITLNQSADPAETKTIGMGLAPGDDYYNEPYFYINTWPYVGDDQIKLEKWTSAGIWHTKDWIGAVLPASTIITWKSADQQQKEAGAFIWEGLEKFRRLLA